MQFGMPMIPGVLMHEMYALVADVPTLDSENGGQWIPGTSTPTPFQGCVMPMSEDDWRKAPQGTYTQNSRKVYTNGFDLPIGRQVIDPQDGETYTITGDLNHGSIHPMRRYAAERKGMSAAK